MKGKKDVIITVQCDSCRVTDQICYFGVSIDRAMASADCELRGQSCHSCNGTLEVISGRSQDVKDIEPDQGVFGGNKMILQEIDKIGGIDFDLKLTFDNGEKYRLRLSGSDYNTFWNMSYYDDDGRPLLFPDCVIGGGRCRLSLNGRVIVGQVKLIREMSLAARWINRKLGLDEYHLLMYHYGNRFGFEYESIPTAQEVMKWAKCTSHHALVDVHAANEIVREIRWLKEPLD